MKRTRFALILFLLISLAVTAAAAEYTVILPEGYEGSGLNYPVIYVMPDTAGSADPGGLAGRLQDRMAAGDGIGMIIVCPVLDEGSDPAAEMDAIIAEVDGSYRTIPDARHRAAAGTGRGGYLSYMLALADDSPFGATVSVRGDFSSGGWDMGSVYDRVKALYAADRTALDGIYTYMDAPVDDEWTDLPGSTDDLGALMIGYGTGSARHEFTVRPGVWDDAFLEESAGRVLKRLTGYMLEGLAEAVIEPTQAAVTAEDGTVGALCTVTLSEGIAAYAPEGTGIVIGLNVNGQEAQSALNVTGPGTYTAELTVANTLTESAEARMTLTLLGAKIDMGSCPVVFKKGSEGFIDLSDGWRFNYTGLKSLDAAALTADDILDWPAVQPGLTSWTKGFGNISDENVRSSYGPDYFDFFIIGNGYYALTFTLPEGCDEAAPELSVGCVDDRCEVYLNGVKVGATGLDDRGAPNGETTWAVYSHFTLDGALLNKAGENLLVVRAWNDQPFGAGGWYAGPIGLYTPDAFAAATAGNERFYEETFLSPHAAAALGQAEPKEVPYLIYLPPDYGTSDRRYPVMVLMHQFNSDHTSYRTDGIDKLLDEGILAGLYDPMIAVIPNSDGESWWRGEWEKMITEDLLPHIDSHYRTIPDARFRLTAGCSMGGQGAYGVALQNPDHFSGAVSFYGAFSYGGTANPVAVAGNASKEYMDYFALYFSCGNQDSYGFGVPAILLHQKLREMGTEHLFFIENGGHEASFYLPRFQEAIAYIRDRMFRPGELPGGLISGTAEADGAHIRVTVAASEALSDLMLTVPASPYTLDPTPALSIPVRVAILRDGETEYTEEFMFPYRPDEANAEFDIDLTNVIDPGSPFDTVVTAWIFGEPVTLCGK